MSMMAWIVVGLNARGFAKALIPGGGKWATQAITAIALSIILPFLGLSGIAFAQSQQAMRVYIDGQLMNFDVPPTIVQGRVLVPLRGVFEQLGATVDYDAQTQHIVAIRGAQTVELTLGSRQARVNAMPSLLDVPAFTIAGRTMVPLRFISEALGANVQWVEASQTILIGTTGVAQAQPLPAGAAQTPPPPTYVQGTIDAVDCQAQTVVVDTANSQQTFLASDNAFTNVDATNLSFCSLEGYVGAPATVWLAPDDNQLVVTEVDVTGPVATAPVTAEVVSPLPIWGTVLGTVVAAGLLYLVTRGPDGNYYRYPYYGAYYRHYYNSGYRPYTGVYSASAPIVTVALAILGVVLGTVVVNGDPFIVSRDPGGHIYRYPYYGPYHQYYYRPAYQPYAGPNVNVYMGATVRQGDSHWDAPAHAMAQVYGTPAVRTFPQQPPRPGTHQLTGTPSGTRQPQPGTQQQPATHQPTTPAPRQPQPETQQQQPATHQPTSPQRPPTPAAQPRAPQRPGAQQCGGPNQPACSTGGPPAPAAQPPAPQTPGAQQCGGPNQPACSTGGPSAPAAQPPTRPEAPGK